MFLLKMVKAASAMVIVFIKAVVLKVVTLELFDCIGHGVQQLFLMEEGTCRV